MGKIKITNINKFISFIIILVLIIVFILVLVISLNNKSINENTDISKLNSSKYSNEILEEYEKVGKMEQFIEEYNAIQNSIGVYLIDNATLDDNSFDNIVLDVQKKLKSNDWKALNIDKPSEWNGEWSLDDNGNLKFRFSSKKIEPSWIQNDNVSSKIILN